MFRKIAAAVAALGLSVTAASAATPLNFTEDGSTYFATANFTPPAEGTYQYIHLWWSAGEPQPGGLVLTLDYEHRYLYWDSSMDMVWGNESDYTANCVLGQPCFSIVAPGHAVGRIATPRGRGRFEDCQPGHKSANCYEWYVPHRAMFDVDFALSGGPPSAYFELGKSGGIPEPATWAMMITGFGLLGAAMRRRRDQLA